MFNQNMYCILLKKKFLTFCRFVNSKLLAAGDVTINFLTKILLHNAKSDGNPLMSARYKNSRFFCTGVWFSLSKHSTKN